MSAKTTFPSFWLFLLLLPSIAGAQDRRLGEHVLFYSSFNGTTSAEVAAGDSQIYTAESYKEADRAKPGLHNPEVVLAKGAGLTGDALHFTKKNTSAIFYDGNENVGYSSESWSGTISFWIQLDPDADLEPGYCDPIQVTDVSYNDAALWVDFTDDSPREFRLGVLGDLDVWNPDNAGGEADVERRTVTVKNPPFKRGKWTSIVITFSEINTQSSTVELYLDGEYKGVVEDVNDPFTWQEEKAKIMLGLSYVGLMDELAVFDKPLSSNEVKFIYELEDGIETLFK